MKGAANDLNDASDGLTTVVSDFEAILKPLNLGTPAWVTISTETDHDFWQDTVEIGYARIGSKWGVAIRKVVENLSTGEDPDVTQWLFNDAPRRLRLDAIDNLPRLVDALTAVALTATAAIRKKSEQAAALVAALKAPATSGTAKDANAAYNLDAVSAIALKGSPVPLPRLRKGGK